MNRCEDYPCCGHGDGGDSGGCPDAQGRFNCTVCGKKLARNVSSSMCGRCRVSCRRDDDIAGQDQEAEYGAFC